MTHTRTTPAPSTPATCGRSLHDSPAVRAAIESLVEQVEAASARIIGPRGPIAGLERPYDELVRLAGETRGRPLLYPCLGSGLGRGALLELADGSVKWDMITGIGVHFFGHSDGDLIAAALRGALDDTLKQGNLQASPNAYDFISTLLRLAGRSSRLKHAYVSTSGAMANEHALKVCYQKHAPADRVIAFKDCFMGRSIVMSHIGDSAANRVGLPGGVFVDYMPFWDPEAARTLGKQRVIDAAVARLRELIDRYPGRYACFIFELVQGEGGFNVGDRDYFKALMDVCKQHDIAVWDDEIQTFGRGETMFAYEHFDLGDYVDVLCVGKMTQACATLFTADYNPGPGLLSGTFLGEGVSFGVGQRVLDRLEQGSFHGPEGLNARHHRLFREQVHALAARHPAWFPKVPGLADIAGGIGGMMRFTPFGGDKTLVTKACRACFDEGVIVFYCGHGPYHVRMLPPLGVFDERDWPRVFEHVERGLAHAAAS